MKLLPFTTGKAFDTSVMILVDLTRPAAQAAGLFVEADIYFIRFMGPMDLTEASAIGVPILPVVGTTDDDTPSHPLRAEAAEFKVLATKLMAIRRCRETIRAAIQREWPRHLALAAEKARGLKNGAIMRSLAERFGRERLPGLRSGKRAAAALETGRACLGSPRC
jgi:DNA-binding NarL/FixJ family response regulator